MIFLILVLGLLLRLINLNQSLWLDEAIGAIAARDFSFNGIIFDFLLKDNHPPLYYLLLKLWTIFFGFSEMALRLMSVLFGVLSVYLVYLIALKISKNKLLAVLSSLFLATSPLHVYYSQEVRMYPMIALVVALSVYLFLRVIEKQDFLSWSFFSLSLILLFFTDYITVFMFPVFLIFVFLSKTDWKFKKKLFFSFVPLLLTVLIWLPIYRIQSQGGTWLLKVLPAWKDVAGGASIKQLVLIWSKFILGRISLTDKYLYFGLITISSVPFLIGLFKALKFKKDYLFVWLWLLIPLVLGFVISFWIPAFIYFRFIYLLGAFYILTTIGLMNITNKFFRYFLITMILMVNFVGVSIYYLDVNQQRENWVGAILYLKENEKKVSDEIAVFEFPEPFAPYRFYRTDIKGVGVTDSISANKDKTEEIVEKETKGKNRIFYFEYLKDLSDPGNFVLNKLYSLNFKEVGAKSFVGVGKVSILQR